MTRTERIEYNDIKRTIRNELKNNNLGYSAQLTIRTNAGSEYKKALNDLYTSLDFHPAAVRTDPHYFDDNERIIYIKGIEEDGIHWTQLYSESERKLFADKLN